MPDADGHRSRLDTDELLLQRARVLEGLAASAWHELAQPLGGLRGFATMLQLEGWTTAQLGLDPRLVEAATQETERLAHTLTDLARGSARPLPLRTLVGDVLALAGHLLVDVGVEVEIPDDAPEPDVDFSVLRLVVASILMDSIAALGGSRQARGRMRWSASVTKEGADRHELVLALDDGAPARRPADLELLARQLAMSGGRLEHAPSPTGGNRYAITLRVATTAAVPATTRDTEPRSASHRLTVLVCDDEESVRGLLVRVLDRSGMRTLAVASGPAALEVLDREPVDVVITDQQMGGMTGAQLHAAAIDRQPALRHRFVLMSGNAGDEELVAFAEAEGLEVLAKPFEFGSLAGLLREVAAR